MAGALLTKWAKLIMITFLLFIAQLIISKLSCYVSAAFDLSAIDRDGTFLQVTVHHIVQMAAALIMMHILHRSKNITGFKLAPSYDKRGVKYTLLFCTILLAYYSVVYTVGHFTQSIAVYEYELNRTNVLGTLGFQLLLSGPSEEILFRALPIVLYQQILNTENKADRAIAVGLSALLFGAGHINVFQFNIPWFQVCYAAVLGTVYGYTFIKTNSIIYPMVQHSLSNVISVGGCYLYMMFLR